MEFLKRKLLLELPLLEPLCPEVSINSFVTSATGASPEGFAPSVSI
jgi:hypothetical protein